jgi:hypothetical protein
MRIEDQQVQRGADHRGFCASRRLGARRREIFTGRRTAARLEGGAEGRDCRAESFEDRVLVSAGGRAAGCGDDLPPMNGCGAGTRWISLYIRRWPGV